MALTREQVTRGLVDELAQFEALVRSLDEREWASPAGLDGWKVADLAAHVAGDMTDVTTGHIDCLDSPEVVDRHARERRGHSPSELADELVGATQATTDLLARVDDSSWDKPAPGGLPFTLGEAVQALWHDVYLLAQDIRTATGRPLSRGAGLLASVSHLAGVLRREGWRLATLALDGLPEIPVGGGAGRKLTGDPLAFVLAVTGRLVPEPLRPDRDKAA
jgi:uncharacterized protein (TIGR03083 family)